MNLQENFRLKGANTCSDVYFRAAHSDIDILPTRLESKTIQQIIALNFRATWFLEFVHHLDSKQNATFQELERFSILWWKGEPSNWEQPFVLYRNLHMPRQFSVEDRYSSRLRNIIFVGDVQKAELWYTGNNLCITTKHNKFIISNNACYMSRSSFTIFRHLSTQFKTQVNMDFKLCN